MSTTNDTTRTDEREQIRAEAAELLNSKCKREQIEILATMLRRHESVRAALGALRPPLAVCSDLPMYGLANVDHYRVVCSANQNNSRHYGTSEPWAGIPERDVADALATIVNHGTALLDAVEQFAADLDRLAGPVCDYPPCKGRRAIEHSQMEFVTCGCSLPKSPHRPDAMSSAVHPPSPSIEAWLRERAK